MTSATDQIEKLIQSIQNTNIPQELKDSILLRLEQLKGLTNSPAFLPEFDRINKYIEWVVVLPWNTRTEDNLDLTHARKILEKNHYGLSGIKERVLEYISVMRLKAEKHEGNTLRAPILCFVGLVGTGKTTIASSIAEAMGRNFARIPFGGMGDPLDLRGQSRMYPEAEPGRVMKALQDTQSKNCVILLDEIDRVTDQGRSSIMGVLVELLDPEQNRDFVDHYIDFPFDLSEVLFIATANNTHSISTAVLDRIEPIQMPSYSDNEKITIAQRYMLPKLIALSGIPPDSIAIADDVWPLIVRPLGFDAGMRTMERTLQGVVRKVALKLVEGGDIAFKLTKENIKEYIP